VWIDAPGVDRARMRKYIGKTAFKFYDTNLNVGRQNSK
jgi:hypothetical protein